MSKLGLGLLAAALATGAACTIQETDFPPLAGPSDFALSVSMAANPASITQDGTSQSAIVVTARDTAGQPMPNVPFRLDILVGGIPVDYGRLSGKTVVTGSDGRAHAVYTAPPPLPPNAQATTCTPTVFSPSLPGMCVDVTATPIGSNFETVSAHHVQIHLMPTGVILPPAETPTARFVITPASVVPGQQVLFDGSRSCAGSGPCSTPAGITSFSWSFGDGSNGSGQTVTHDYAQPGTYAVTLTVTNDRGVQASTTQTITVGPSAPPSAQIVVSPIQVVSGDTVLFSVANATAGAGRTIVSFAWNFGDPFADPATNPNTAIGPSVSHVYTRANTYTVVLTITDDFGQVTNVSRSVTVD